MLRSGLSITVTDIVKGNEFTGQSSDTHWFSLIPVCLYKVGDIRKQSDSKQNKSPKSSNDPICRFAAMEKIVQKRKPPNIS